MGPLLRLMDSGLAASSLRFGFFASSVSFGTRLILLGDTFPLKIRVTGQSSSDLFRLSFQSFYGALGPFLRS